MTEVERKRYHGLLTAHFLIANGPMTVSSNLGINVYKIKGMTDFSMKKNNTDVIKNPI